MAPRTTPTVLFPQGSLDPAYQAEKTGAEKHPICLRCKQGANKCRGVQSCVLRSNCFYATKYVAYPALA